MHGRNNRLHASLIALSIGWLAMSPPHALAATGGNAQPQGEFFWYFVGLVVWVTLSLVAVLSWPIYIWRCRRRERKAAQQIGQQPTAQSAHADAAITANPPTPNVHTASQQDRDRVWRPSK